MPNIVFCSAELAPFAKVGGLGDVLGSLPKALMAQARKEEAEADKETSVSVMMPRYGGISPEDWGFSRLETSFIVEFNGNKETLGVWKGVLPNCDAVAVYMLEHVWFAERDEVYPPGDADYEMERFQFFNHAVLKGLEALGIQPDILHVHDWHTSMIPAWLSAEPSRYSYFARTKTVLTIHNLAYQGWQGERNWLAEGIKAADFLTTVSPTYAREIQTEEYGCGLDALLRESSGRLQGIINGIDTETFNPKTDKALSLNYDMASMLEGKAACKLDLQRMMGLDEKKNTPLFGFISRLVDQKGLDLLLPALTEILEENATLLDAQWVILGSGEAKYEEALSTLARRFPQLSVHVGFDLALAQKIYAGSDFFLMPSRFEPCGLGQLIAMRYGSIPVVRSTGGLADTVIDIRQDPEGGTGLCFKAYESTAFLQAIRAAEGCYFDETLWPTLCKNTMDSNFTWETSAKAYCAIYNSLDL